MAGSEGFDQMDEQIMGSRNMRDEEPDEAVSALRASAGHDQSDDEDEEEEVTHAFDSKDRDLEADPDTEGELEDLDDAATEVDDDEDEQDADDSASEDVRHLHAESAVLHAEAPSMAGPYTPATHLSDQPEPGSPNSIGSPPASGHAADEATPTKSSPSGGASQVSRAKRTAVKPPARQASPKSASAKKLAAQEPPAKKVAARPTAASLTAKKVPAHASLPTGKTTKPAASNKRAPVKGTAEVLEASAAKTSTTPRGGKAVPHRAAGTKGVAGSKKLTTRGTPLATKKAAATKAAPAKKTSAPKAPAKKVAAKKTLVKVAAKKTVPAKKAAPPAVAKKAAKKTVGTKSSTAKAPVKKAALKKSTAKK